MCHVFELEKHIDTSPFEQYVRYTSYIFMKLSLVHESLRRIEGYQVLLLNIVIRNLLRSPRARNIFLSDPRFVLIPLPSPLRVVCLSRLIKRIKSVMRVCLNCSNRRDKFRKKKYIYRTNKYILQDTSI